MAIMTAHFGYDAEFWQPRKWNVTKKRLRAETPVLIEEVDGSRAPVAARCKSSSYGGGVVEYRWDGEHLYRPMRGLRGRTLDLAGFEEEFAERRDQKLNPSGVRFQGGDKPWHWDDFPFPRAENEAVAKLERAEDLEIKEWVSDDRSLRDAECSAAASRLRLIDGMLFMRCREPTIRLHLRHGVPSATLCDREARIEPHVYHLRLDKADEVAQILGALNPKFHQRKFSDVVEVLLPEALRHDDFLFAAKALKHEVVPSLAHGVGTLRSAAAVQAYLALREIADDWDYEDRHVAEAMFSALETFAAQDLRVRYDQRTMSGDVVTTAPAGYSTEAPFGLLLRLRSALGQTADADAIAAMTL